ncbi:MAG: Cell division protein FtsH [uncultured Frankineae bacterium]|uniref:Cell division protein FtsH n=1 Tax=uncultured Frankineae bacterium TaxID=437475 RepID=A0A6J4MMH7_9ACTN|nr:MAG: Cell division protein FtsH [uncultured Frankineae bacterium]
MLALTAVLRSSARYDRHGIVRLPQQAMSALGVADGGVVVLRGRRTSAAIAVTAEGCPPGSVLCDELVLSNLSLTDGDRVEVEAAPRTEASRLTVTGPDGVARALDPAVLRTALLGKVVMSGDQVSLRPSDLAPPVDFVRLRGQLTAWLGAGWTSQVLHVTDTEPAGPVLVTMGTVTGWRGGTTTTGEPTPEPAPVPATAGAAPRALADLPGLESQAAALREWLDLGFHHRDLLARLGASPGMGVLLTGPSGSGKAALVEAVATEVGARLVQLWGPQLAATEANAAAKQVVDTLARASREAPTVVLVVDVEAVAPREGAGPLLPVLLTALRELVQTGRAAVVCTTSHPERVTPELRTPGTLDHELALPLPDRKQRLRLLEVATRSVPLAEDVALDDVAGRTPGFVAADVLALVREAGLRAAARQRDAESPTVGQVDLEAALEVVRATSMEGSTLDLSPLTLDDVGDMADVKQALTEAVLWPLDYPDTFARLGVAPPRGLLLYGPPGCGKTFLVKAIAGSGQANVLSVKGAELLSKWVGESERAVRELFRRARESAPAIVFLDEVDALAPVRGQSTDGGTTDRVVAALLTELDGVEDLRNVVVLGATNRPDLIDPALLRPGRLERLVFAPPPDAEARAAILRAAASGVPLADDVDLVELGRRTERFSGADCTALVREAALTAMRESMQATTVTAAHLEQALTTVRPSLDPAQVADLAAYAERRAAR